MIQCVQISSHETVPWWVLNTHVDSFFFFFCYWWCWFFFFLSFFFLLCIILMLYIKYKKNIPEDKEDTFLTNYFYSKYFEYTSLSSSHVYWKVHWWYWKLVCRLHSDGGVPQPWGTMWDSVLCVVTQIPRLRLSCLRDKWGGQQMCLRPSIHSKRSSMGWCCAHGL